MGKVDVAAAILKLGLKEIPKKALKEKTGLAPDELEKYLRMLESKGLAAVASGKIVTTKRGMQFLELYSSIHSKYLTVPV